MQAFVSISLKVFGFWCQLDNCFDGTPGNIWLPVAIDIIISFPGGVAFLVWVKKTCWTKYLHRDFKLVRKVCVYLRNILNNFADWKRKCIPASILICFGYWKHWDCLICSSNLWQQMSTHLVWWTSLSNTNTFFFVLASLNSRPSLRHAQIQIFILPLCSGLYSVTVSLVFPSQFLLQIKWLKHTGVLKQASNEVKPAMLKMRIIFFLKKWIITLKY